jgi:predicted nucleic acid-binding protein
MFLDTSGLLALFYSKDPRHSQAEDLFQTAPALWIHNYVLAEFIPLVSSRRLSRRAASGFLRELLAEADLELVWVDRELHDAAMDLLDRRADKDYSLCDAVSFLIMQQHGVSQALTTDQHFEQEGFIRLLKTQGGNEPIPDIRQLAAHVLYAGRNVPGDTEPRQRGLALIDEMQLANRL